MKEETSPHGTIVSINDLPEIPKYFPDLIEPEENKFTQERWDLGKKLFYDPILSIDSSISCGSCHMQRHAFTDQLQAGKGVQGRFGTRNTPTLANTAFHPYYTREGGVPTLEMQILVPIQEHNEFDFNIVEISKRLMQIPEYIDMSQKAYGINPDHFVITRAIACFERSIISGRSKYDLFKFTNDETVFSNNERAGMHLFFSDRLKCGTCHGGFDFTSYEFDNNGLYDEYKDVGRYRLTMEDVDFAMFKIPSLRNVEITGPYMHDGSMNTLEQVIEHYSTGGKNNAQKNKSIKQLKLTDEEKMQLVAFLKTLTDEIFINNKKFNE